jgi:hypothetical protein
MGLHCCLKCKVADETVDPVAVTFEYLMRQLCLGISFEFDWKNLVHLRFHLDDY